MESINGWPSPTFINSLKTNTTFQMLLENIPVLVYVYQGDKVIYVNPAVEKTLGYTFEEMTAFNFWDICHKDYKDLIKKRGYARLRGEQVPTNYEFKIHKKNGEAIWVDVFFARTEVQGLPLSIVGAVEISEKKELQEQLQKAHGELESRVEKRTQELIMANQELVCLNENLNNVVQNMSDGVVIVDEQGHVEILNPVIEKIWGDLFKQIKPFVTSGLRSRKSKYIDRMLYERVAFRDKEIIFSTDKGPIHFLASGTPIINVNSQIKKGLVIIRPIQDVHRLVNRFAGSQARYTFDDIITNSNTMFNMMKQAKNAAGNLSNILIQGESGTGKEMFAQAIHSASNRKQGPFIAVNCGAIPRDLVGSELFGYVEGAFTGAKKEGNPGKFELASGGTLFLDEIGDMPFEQQAALLRVIQERAVNRIGSNSMIPVDVRIICATNKNLREEVRKGNFRADLFYRLNVIFINIPPLRERPEDIFLLLDYFLEKTSVKFGLDYTLHSSIINPLLNYSWPGNVRELENVVERILNQSQGGCIDAKFLPSEFTAEDHVSWPSTNIFKSDKNMTLLEARSKQKEKFLEIEKQQIINLLEIHRGNISQVARDMGMARSTIYKKMREYKI